MSRVKRTVNPWVRIALLVVLIAALILGVIYLGIKRRDEREESAARESESNIFSTITLWENETEKIVSITAARRDGTTELLSRKDEYGIVTWYQAEYPNRKLNDEHGSLVGMAEKMTAYDIIRENPTGEDLEEFGLANPYCRLTVKLEDGTEKTMLIGDLNLKANYCYVMPEGSDTIYSTSYLFRGYAAMTTEHLYFISIDQFVYTDNFSYAQFIKKGEPVIWLMAYDSQEGFQQNYIFPLSEICFYSPMDYRRVMVRPDLLSTVLNANAKNYVQAVEVVNYDATAEELEAYGLSPTEPEYFIHQVWYSSSPDADGNYRVYEREFYFGFPVADNPDLVYFRQGEDNMVYTVTMESLTQYSFDPMDYCWNNVFLSRIEFIDSIELSFEDEAYSFKLTPYIREEDDKTDYYVKCNGEDVDTSAFKDFLGTQLFLLRGDKCIWESETEHGTDDVIHLVYNMKDGTVRDITFYRSGDFTYVTKMQDQMWFACNYYQFDLMKEAVRELVNAE